MSDVYAEAYRQARDWLDGLDTAPMGARLSAPELQSAFEGPLPRTGQPADKVIRFLAETARPGLMGNAGARFYGWVNGGAVPSSLGADWLVSAWDQNAALSTVSPVASAIEAVAGKWMKALLRLPEEASFAFTTGCQMAHMTALAAARHAVLADIGWDVETDGLMGAPPIRVFTSRNRHGSVERALRYLGLGTNALHPVATDEMGRMRPEALEAEMIAYQGPAILALNAGDLNVGAFDNFADLIPIAKAHGAWVHVDGAFGLFAQTSKAKRHLTAGIEKADSWATDGHKWLNVPFDCGMAIINNPDAHKAAMTLNADYITATPNARDPIDWNLEWSRRARAIPVYAALMEMGAEGVEAMIDRTSAHCRALIEGIGALPGGEIIACSEINQGLVRFVRAGASEAENDAFTETVMQAVNASGEAFFTSTLWQGRRCMRVSVVSWRTGTDDVTRSLGAIKQVLAEKL